MKKIIIAAVFILFLLIILLYVFSNFRRAGNTNGQPLVTPTTVPFSSSPIVSENTNRENSPVFQAAVTLAPFETNDFKYDYSPERDILIVTEKTPEGFSEFVNWTEQMGLPELAGNPEFVAIESVEIDSATGLPITSSPEESPFTPIFDLFNIFLNFGQGINNSGSPQPTVTPPPPSSGLPPNSQPPSGGSPSMTYYAQCNGFGSLPLPLGCTLCEAGCGPTTVAMIASSYLGKQYDPKAIVDLYSKNNYYLSCAGSRYSDAKSALEGLGLRTTSYMMYSLATADEVASDFKKYIDSGWTIFTLANYCDGGCGHFFWVTEVKNGNIMAYDPFYGRSSTPPINENSRFPFPKYRVAFGVKK